MKMMKSIGSGVSAILFSCMAFAQQNQGTGPVQVSGSNPQQGAPGAPAWINFVLIGGIILFMWLFVFRPQSKRAKEQKDFLASLTSGLEVITSGGLIGTIVEVKDNIVTLNIGNSNIRVLKSSVSGKLNTSHPADSSK